MTRWRASLHHTPGAWAGCVSEGDPEDHPAQRQPANVIKEDGSGRAAGLSRAAVADRSSIFLPLVPCNKPG